MREPRGFSLIEMAVVLLVITLLLGGLLVPFGTQVEQRRIAETQKGLEEIKEALLGFAVANGRLPCPDTDNDGLADACAPGTESGGGLPWSTLGTGNADAWGNHFHYRVTNLFTVAGSFPLGTNGTLNICSVAGCPAGTSVAQNIPAVVVSHGRNGYGAINANNAAGNMATIPCAPPACPADEAENMNADNNYVSRTITTANTGAGEFDDLVVWISPNILFNRMVAAGRLP